MRAIFLISVLGIGTLVASVSDTFHHIEEMILQQSQGAYLNLSENDLYSAVGHRWIKPEMLEIFEPAQENVLRSHSICYRGRKDLAEKLNWTGYVTPLSPALLSTPSQEITRRLFDLLASQSVIFVGDSKIPQKTRELLFGSNSKFVPTSPQIAEGELDRIEVECLSQLSQCKGFTVLVLGVDKIGKGLAMRLLNKTDSVFVLDLGYLKEPFRRWKTTIWEDWLNRVPVIQTGKEKIKILYTSALLPNKFEERKNEYIKSLHILETYGFKDQTYVVESMGFSPIVFFEKYCAHVLYANINDGSYINRYVNEAVAMLLALDFYNFDDDDMIVKLTGRYFFNTDKFLRTIEDHPEMDGFASYCVNSERGVQTGCFAMRCKEFKQMLREIDLDWMEEKLVDIEWIVGQYLKKMSFATGKVLFVEKTGITANVTNHHIEQW